MGACLACAACQTCTAVCGVCCSCAGCFKSGGVDQASAPLVGRVRALGLMLFSVVLAVLGQYEIYKLFDGRLDSWSDGCDDESYSDEYRDICIGNTFVYRVSFVDAVFFLAMAFCACCSSAFNNGFWGFKIFIWLVLLVATVFISNDVFDISGYVWVARIGAFLFVIMQQLVLIDLAYRVNDTFVDKANELGDDGDGRPYLVALVAISSILYLGSLAAIGAMFHYFSGCPVNELVISLTLILPIIVTILQLSGGEGGEGNLLSSAVVTAYCTFLCFTAVSKTPRESCNPFVHDNDVTSIVIGVVLTVLSLFWVTLNAARTVTALLGGSGDKVEETPGPMQTPNVGEVESGDKTKPFVQGPVAVSDQPAGTSEPNPGSRPATSAPPPAPEDDGGLGWRFNVVMVLISMFYAMMLTNWGDINTDGSTSDPKNGWTALWLITAGQWVCFMLYAWTLAAPRMFPDRDFS